MLQNSVLLEYLIENAEKLKLADGKKRLSANYFLISLLKIFLLKRIGALPERIRDDASVSELAEAESLLDRFDLEYEKTIIILDRSIHAEGYNSIVDEFFYDKIKYNAESRAKLLHKDVIDTCVYLTMIIDEPSKAIREHVLHVEQASTKKAADFAVKLEAAERSPEPVPDEEKKTDEEKAEQSEQNELTGIQQLSKTVGNTRDIQKRLLDNIFGQDHAINTFISGYFQSELMAQIGKDNKKPKATFLFAGPPGVGKTFLAESAAEALKLPFKRFDMSEYSDKEAALEFCGADKVYRDSKEGVVTGFVAENPKCVLLFDEIEKAHINVIYLFLQILDAGRIRDNHTDEEVSFTDTVIIFTTNAGKNLYEDTTVSNLSALPRNKIIKALSTDVNPDTKSPLFPAAICSRFASGNVVMFNHLGVNNLYTISKRELEKSISGFKTSTGIDIEMDDKVPTAIILSEGGKADARTVKGRSAAFFHEELYELFRLLAVRPEVVESLKTIKVNASFDNEYIAKLFEDPSRPEVLVFGDPERYKSLTKLESIKCHLTDRIDEAKEILYNNDIAIILCDIFCNSDDSVSRLLNVEDIYSEGHDFLMYALSRHSMPIHILQSEAGAISQEEFLSFAKLGVHDILTFNSDDLEERIIERCNIAYQQGSMLKLARENKVISYKTSQTVSEDGAVAEIDLFDFKLCLATDTDDSKNILDSVSKPNIGFGDVIGAEDAKRELTYFVEYLKDPVKYMRKGVRAPKGVLLYGPPGTGKTLLAKAMAGESDVTFLTAEGNQFQKSYIGEGAEAVHKLFATARKYAPSILFIDEIDAIGKDRKASDTHSSVGDILTAFLTEMDGFNTDSAKPVFVLAATNYDVEPGSGRSLDPALLRRFDRRIYVDLPTKDERKRFLYMKVSKSKMVSLSDEQIENIAVRSTGMSLAELDSVCEMALRNAIRSEECVVDDTAFEEAFETFNGGEKKQWSEELLERTARHEAGHALLCWLGGEKPSYLTIVARGNHGGYMQHSDNEAKALYTKAEILSRIRVALAGRAAEMVYYGASDGLSTGASGDLSTATHLAEQMISKYGMDEKTGLSYLDDRDTLSVYYNEVRSRTNEILSEELKNTIRIISENTVAINKLVEALLEKNHLKENEIDEILKESTK